MGRMRIQYAPNVGRVLISRKNASLLFGGIIFDMLCHWLENENMFFVSALSLRGPTSSPCVFACWARSQWMVMDSMGGEGSAAARMVKDSTDGEGLQGG